MLLVISCLTVALLAAAAPTSTEPGPDPFEFEFTELAPGVWAGQRPDPARRPVSDFELGQPGEGDVK